MYNSIEAGSNVLAVLYINLSRSDLWLLLFYLLVVYVVKQMGEI